MNASVTQNIQDLSEIPAALDVSDRAERIKDASRQIAYLDDDPDFARLIKIMGALLGHTVTLFHDPAEAEDTVRLYPEAFDTFMSDYQMPLADGIDVVQRVKRAHPHLDCAVISSDEWIVRRADVRALKIATAIKPNCLRQLELLLALIKATSR